MKGPALCVFLLGLTLCAQGSGERPLLVPQAGSVYAFVPGAPPTIVAHCGGLLAALRADLQGNWLARDLFFARLVRGGGDGGMQMLALPAHANDAVLIEEERVAAVLPQGSTGQLLLMDRTGAVLCSLVLPRMPLRIAACERGLLLLVRDTSGRQYLESRNAVDGTLRATRLLSWPLRDLSFDDEGLILVPDRRGAVEFLEQGSLSTRRTESAPAGLVEVQCCGGTALCGLLEPAHVLWMRHASGLSQQLPVGYPMRLEALPSGGTLVRELCSGSAHQVERDGLRWFGWAPGAFDFSDGAGLRHGRGRALERDDDGDGFSTAVELREGTDPGAVLSLPFVLRQSGPLLHLWAPLHGCSIFWIHAEGSARFPGFVVPPSVWVSSTVGTLDPAGDGWLLLSGGAGLPDRVRASLFDPQTGCTLTTSCEELRAW